MVDSLYKTGNGIGSTDAKDLHDNAIVFDKLVNGDDLEVQGRRDKELKSIAYLQNIITSLDVGNFTFSDVAAGLAGTSSGQYFRVMLQESTGTDTAFSYYKNDGGAATFLTSLANDNKLSRIVFDKQVDDLFYIVDSEGNVAGAFGMSSDGELLLQSRKGLNSPEGFSSTTFKLSSVEQFPFVATDSEGNILFYVTNDNQFIFKGSSSFGSSPKTELKRNKLTSAITTSFSQKATKKLNLWIFYGQSYSIGADSERVLTTLNYDGSLMVGTQVYGTETNGVKDYSPATDANFHPLVASGKESPSIGFVNELKRLNNDFIGKESDTEHLYAAIEAGTGSRAIADLLSGDCWDRLVSAIDYVVKAASAQGYEVCVPGFIYIQGENDNQQTYDYYLSQLGVMRAQMQQLVSNKFGTTRDVDFYVGQIGGWFAGSAEQNVPRAQMDFCKNTPNTHFIESYQALPSQPSGWHLLANSYRWMGCHAAKIAHKVRVGQKHTIFRMSDAVHSGNTLYVSFDVPVPPLQFQPAYLKSVATTFSDKGFTVSDGNGDLKDTDLTVTIEDGDTIKIVTSRALTGGVSVTLGDSTYHSGKHNICDSDPSLSMYQWDINPSTTAPDYIPELNGKNYALRNWAGLDKIKSREV